MDQPVSLLVFGHILLSAIVMSCSSEIWWHVRSIRPNMNMCRCTMQRRAGLSRDASFKFGHWVLTNTDYDCEVENEENRCHKWRGWRPFQWREKSRPENWIHATKSFWVADSTLSTGVTYACCTFWRTCHHESMLTALTLNESTFTSLLFLYPTFKCSFNFTISMGERLKFTILTFLIGFLVF